jgi:hypothetical protein
MRNLGFFKKEEGFRLFQYISILNYPHVHFEKVGKPEKLVKEGIGLR